jgi:zinc/manganese transport system substrate-binding protein
MVVVGVRLAPPVQRLAVLSENGVDGTTLSERAEIVVDGGQTNSVPAGAELSVKVLGAAEIAASDEHLVEGALLAGASLPRHTSHASMLFVMETIPDKAILRSGQRRDGAFGARLLGSLTASALLAAACASAPPPPARGTVAVVAAENFWGDIARQIGGSHVSVTSIISDPNADPHTYETNPRDASAISGASFVIENGAGYDDFVDKLLSTNPNASRDVINVASAVGVTGSNANPHLWYDPDYVTAISRVIERHLAAHDPADAAVFRSNLRTFLAAYQPYIDTLAMIRARYAGIAIAYTERVAGYLVQRGGLRLVTPASFAQSIEDGNEPSPSDVAAMDRTMTGRRARLLLYNAQVTSPATQTVRNLATANGVPVVGVAETIPAGASNFQAWQIAQARAILTALGG